LELEENEIHVQVNSETTWPKKFGHSKL